MQIVMIIMILLGSHPIHVTAPAPTPGPGHLYGAWEMKKNSMTCVKIYTPSYFIYSVYDQEGKSFIEAAGGTWEMSVDGVVENYEFHTTNPDLVGENINYRFNGQHDSEPISFTVEKNGIKQTETWNRIDDGTSPLFGAWRITQRETNGQMNPMQQGPRKTMKVLSGSRFQWAAFNIETKQFSGTGGGTFTTKDGKYIENIEFFSRDNSRVGASLEFDFEVNERDWHHKGLSSTGNPIFEIWTKQDSN